MITARHQLSFFGFVLVGLLVVLGGAWAGYTSARADTPLVAQADTAPAPAAVQVEPFAPPAESAAPASPEVAAPPAPSSAAAPSAPTEKPSEQLANPIDDPVDAYSDAKAAHKQGWAVFVLACLVMTTAALARAGQKWGDSKLLAWFTKNKTLVYVVSSVGVVASAAFDALVLGGTWYAAGYAALGAVLTLVAPKPGEIA